MTATQTIKALTTIPGVGKSIATDLYNIGIRDIYDLKGKDPEVLYNNSNLIAGCVQDRCLLYVFRCAVYFAETPPDKQDPEKRKWWNWKDK
ncbi:MAG TPA: helix-hairpin-helix domain-containing protein [Agriterribacter sp.]|nr:pathogenicity locus [Chitinophagaceae bacterium]HRP30742.1 helix-hairpin-helix domain-containing protein [Agriterribacter sp.]